MLSWLISVNFEIFLSAASLSYSTLRQSSNELIAVAVSIIRLRSLLCSEQLNLCHFRLALGNCALLLLLSPSCDFLLIMDFFGAASDPIFHQQLMTFLLVLKGGKQPWKISCSLLQVVDTLFLFDKYC